MSVWRITAKICRRWKPLQPVTTIALRRRFTTSNLYEPCIFLNYFRSRLAQREDVAFGQSKRWIDQNNRWVPVIAIEKVICAADGVLSDKEKNAMIEQKRAYGIPQSVIDEGMRKGDEWMNNPKALDDFVENEWEKDLKHNPYAPMAHNVIASCLFFAAVDGLHPDELKKANEVALKIGMSQQGFDKLLTALEKEEQLYRDFYEILVQFPDKK